MIPTISLVNVDFYAEDIEVLSNLKRNTLHVDPANAYPEHSANEISIFRYLAKNGPARSVNVIAEGRIFHRPWNCSRARMANIIPHMHR